MISSSSRQIGFVSLITPQSLMFRVLTPSGLVEIFMLEHVLQLPRLCRTASKLALSRLRENAISNSEMKIKAKARIAVVLQTLSLIHQLFRKDLIPAAMELAQAAANFASRRHSFCLSWRNQLNFEVSIFLTLCPPLLNAPSAASSFQLLRSFLPKDSHKKTDPSPGPCQAFVSLVP